MLLSHIDEYSCFVNSRKVRKGRLNIDNNFIEISHFDSFQNPHTLSDDKKFVSQNSINSINLLDTLDRLSYKIETMSRSEW